MRKYFSTHTPQGLFLLGVIVFYLIYSFASVYLQYDDISSESVEVIATEPTETRPDYPDHILEETELAIQDVQKHQTDSSFTFLAISDTHECAENSAANQQAGLAAALIRDSVDIDFATLLGDITAGSPTTTIEEGLQQIRAVNEYLEDAFSGIPNFRAVGNHDPLTYSFSQNNDYLNNSQLFSLIGSYNTGSTFGSESGGYCFRDLEEFKTRVIVLNTSDTAEFTPADDLGCYCISAAQLQWFAETLDLSAKPDAGDWGILLLSHTALDYYSIVQGTGKILDAYLNGTSTTFLWNEKEVSYDYTEKNAAEIIANIHGHDHYPASGNLNICSQTGMEYRSFILHICIPNASFTRNKKLSVDPDAKNYIKIPDSAESTAFNVITIDRNTQSIRCTNYGAGYHRSFTYDSQIEPPNGTYTNLILSAEVLKSSAKHPLDDIGYRNGAYLSSSGLYGTDSKCVITGAIPYKIPYAGLPSSIYIWGADFTDDPHVRFFLLRENKSHHHMFATGEDISDYFAIEKLGHLYYKLTPIESGKTSIVNEATYGAARNCYIALSMEGYGKKLVVTFDEPIIPES